jgi:lipid-A-disaccharide synthase
MNSALQKTRVMIVASEASGDNHGAKLIRAMQELAPATTFMGVGGKQMAAAGCEILIPSEDLAVMGLIEVIGHLPVVWRSFRKLRDVLHGARRPDALVLIDSPEFNLRLAKHAKKAGIPVLYYVSPQVWAWRSGRVRTIARVVDKLAAILPFEPEFYRGLDIDVRYVGHPLLDEFRITRSRQALLEELQVGPDRTVVGLLPGSRRNELKYMLGTLVQTAQQLLSRQPDLHFLVPVASTLTREEISRHFPAAMPITYLDANQASIYDVANACDAVASVSGTVTLQVALVGTPMVIFYKLSPISYAIGRLLVKVDHFGLVNIVAGKRIVKEYAQHEANPDTLTDEIMKILQDKDYAQRIRTDLARIQQDLGAPGCSGRVAGMLLELIGVDRDKKRS